MRWFPQWFRDWRIAEIVGLVLAILALIVGMYHLKEINETVEKVDEVNKSLAGQIQKTDATLSRVRDTLSTRYLSNFPVFLPDITELVRSAKESVVIFCDIPGYGVFSDPENAGRYFDQLEQKRRQPGFRLELTCMDDKSRHEYIVEQFRSFNWQAWQQNQALRHRLEVFAASRDIEVRALSTPENLIAEIEKANAETFQHTFLGKGVRTPAQMPLYFWIADNRAAIFAVPALSADAIEYGFATSDKDLITAFVNMKRRYDEAAARKTMR